ncbi:MAG: hypothetical protein JWP37_3030 [Mucilaginibacter sp.]|nr:hypothetical protein [Mucilaginibacter sp.]
MLVEKQVCRNAVPSVRNFPMLRTHGTLKKSNKRIFYQHLAPDGASSNPYFSLNGDIAQSDNRLLTCEYCRFVSNCIIVYHPQNDTKQIHNHPVIANTVWQSRTIQGGYAWFAIASSPYSNDVPRWVVISFSDPPIIYHLPRLTI